MGSRYTKLNSKYILAKYHQTIDQGTLFERDWTTIGNVHRLEPGKRVYYGSGNFIFTESTFPVYKKKRKNGKWVGQYTYEDVKDAADIVNLITLNSDSENLSDYAYWGSMTELFRGTVEHIIETFPGRLYSTESNFMIHYHTNGSPESWENALGYVLANPFVYNLYDEFTEVDEKDILKYLALSWKKYVLDVYDDGEIIDTENITYYEVVKENEYYDCEGKYYKLFYIIICCGNYAFIVDVYFADGNIVYCYRTDSTTHTFIENYFTEHNIDYDLSAYQQLTGKFVIRPNDEIVEKYFKTLSGFEWKLLNRTSKPLYQNKFLLPIQEKSGNWKLVRRKYTWPSDGYCIDIESTDYDSFITNMIALCEIYDNLWCDSIWRCMVHEAVKNFDWSYRREYDDNDAVDNIEGGNRMKDVMRLYGIIYDTAKRYVDGIGLYNNISYDGYNNCPTAQMSDRNILSGWDIVSTQYQFYWYKPLDTPPETNDIVSMPAIPVNVDEDSPEYIVVNCGNKPQYEIKPNNDISEFVYPSECEELPIADALGDFIPENGDWILLNSSRRVTYDALYGWGGAFSTLMPGIKYEYISRATETKTLTFECGSAYYKKETLFVSDINLDEEFFTSPTTVVNKQANPWINENSYGRLYVEVGYSVVADYTSSLVPPQTPDEYLADYTYNEFPYMLYGENAGYSNYPLYIKVVSNTGTKYYQLIEGSLQTHNEDYVHTQWFPTKRAEAVTPDSTDILFNRALNLSANRILKSKGTKEAVEMVMGLFGFGVYDATEERGDFTLNEQYMKYTVKRYDNQFYFYEEIPENEYGGSGIPYEGTIQDYIIERHSPIDSGAEEYVSTKVTIDGIDYITYYHLNGDNTVYDTIKLLYAHRLTQSDGDEEYSGVPLNETYKGNVHLIIPFYDSKKSYEGNLYFESKGGWCKNGSNATNTWDYSETIAYLHILQKIEDLFNISRNGVNNGDIYFVADVSNYYEYNADVPYYLSNFFKLIDKYNPTVFSSWVNIPIDGPIQFGESGSVNVTYDDYRHAKHLNDIIPSVLFNNPHCGYDRYDMGAEYNRYMEFPYSYSVDNYLFDDEYYRNMASQFYFPSETIGDEKMDITATTYSYGDYQRGSVKTDTISGNHKYLQITLVDNNGAALSQDESTRMHLEYMRNVVMKYVMQVIPSTTLLVLENFETIQPSANDTATIDIVTDGEGTVYGNGEYLKSTMVTLKAVPNDGYHFVGWKNVSDELIGSDKEMTVMVCEDVTYTAVFVENCEMEYGCETVYPNYLTFTANENGSSVGLGQYYSETPVECNIQYKKTGDTDWTDYTVGSEDDDNIVMIELDEGESVMFKGINPNGFYNPEADEGVYCIIDGSVAASGDITSLLNGVGGNVVLPDNCFSNLFYNCDGLTTAPALPATTLAEGCYRSMFYGCTGLTTAPALPATTLVEGCYRSMFNGCNNLRRITCLATDISATDCTTTWVSGVSGNGTFTKASSMTDWTTGVSGIPENWTLNNI